MRVNGSGQHLDITPAPRAGVERKHGHASAP